MTAAGLSFPPPPPPKPDPDQRPQPMPEPDPIKVRYLDMERCCLLNCLNKNPAYGDAVLCAACGRESYWLKGAWTSRAAALRVYKGH